MACIQWLTRTSHQICVLLVGPGRLRVLVPSGPAAPRWPGAPARPGRPGRAGRSPGAGWPAVAGQPLVAGRSPVAWRPSVAGPSAAPAVGAGRVTVDGLAVWGDRA